MAKLQFNQDQEKGSDLTASAGEIRDTKGPDGSKSATLLNATPKPTTNRDMGISISDRGTIFFKLPGIGLFLKRKLEPGCEVVYTED
jgi:hypothetical protein